MPEPTHGYVPRRLVPIYIDNSKKLGLATITTIASTRNNSDMTNTSQPKIEKSVARWGSARPVGVSIGRSPTILILFGVTIPSGV